MAYWNEEETFELISIWNEDNMQVQLEGCKRNREVYSKILRELSLVGYGHTYEQCREKIKKLKAEYKKINDKRKETGQGRYPEWEYYDAIDCVLGHKPSTQPAVVVDALEDIQVQDTQTDDDLLQETGVEVPSNLGTSESTVLGPASTDVTDASGEVATTLQGQKKSIDGTDKYPVENGRSQSLM